METLINNHVKSIRKECYVVVIWSDSPADDNRNSSFLEAGSEGYLTAWKLLMEDL